MFEGYESADICHVYLFDFSWNDYNLELFRKIRWFTRG